MSTEVERIAVLESRVDIMESQLLRTESRLLEVLTGIRYDLKQAIEAINEKHEQLAERNAELTSKVNAYISRASGMAVIILLVYQYLTK